MRTHCYPAHKFTIIVLLTAATRLHAQHYPAGSEGIKAGSLPSPGFTVEDDNSFYYADRMPGFEGVFNNSANGFSTLSYIQVLRFTWMSEEKLFGANYGIGIRVPIEYKETKFIERPLLGPVHLKSEQFGLADVEIQPVLLAWRLKHFDVSSGYSFWAPTGDYNSHDLFLSDVGLGCWTHSFMLGITWYPDASKSWAVSLLNHYDINTAQYSSLVSAPVSPSAPLGIASEDTTLGNIYTLEWAVSKTVVKGVDVGLTGYYQQQVSDTEGPKFFGPTWEGERVHVAGIGPEVGVTIPKLGLLASLRYAYEFSAMDHPKGNLVALSIKKSF